MSRWRRQQRKRARRAKLRMIQVELAMVLRTVSEGHYFWVGGKATWTSGPSDKWATKAP